MRTVRVSGRPPVAAKRGSRAEGGVVEGPEADVKEEEVEEEAGKGGWGARRE